MIVIAKKKDGYICEIDHRELEKFLNLYYNNLKTLNEGDIIDLSKGYDFARETQDALTATAEFIKENKQVIETIFSGISLFKMEKSDD